MVGEISMTSTSWLEQFWVDCQNSRVDVVNCSVIFSGGFCPQ